MWARCAASIALTKAAQLPDEPPSASSACGTFTHSIAESIGNGAAEESQVGRVEVVEGFTLTADQDRVDRALSYIDFVRARAGVKFFEVRVDISHVIGIEGESGTADCVICDTDSQTLEVHDYKDGYGFVDVNTYQLVLYLLGALKEFDYLGPFTRFRVWIHQPRLNRHDSREYTREELGDLQLKLYKAAQRSIEVESLSPNKQLAAATPGKIQCKWCRIRGTCPARAQAFERSLPVPQRALTLTDEQLGAILAKRPEIEAFFKDVAAEALSRAKEGRTIPGWQISTGRAGNRAWAPAMETIIEETLYEVLEHRAYDKTLISPAEAEKRLRKANAPETWAQVEEYITRAPASVTLVPAASGKVVLVAQAVEFEDISANDLL